LGAEKTMKTAIPKNSNASVFGQMVQAPLDSSSEGGAILADPSVPEDGWGEQIDELLSIRNLQDDWDGLRAKAPSTALVDSALRLALNFRTTKTPAPCRIVPDRTGTVIFEWQVGDTYQELEVTRPHHAEFVIITAGHLDRTQELTWQ